MIRGFFFSMYFVASRTFFPAAAWWSSALGIQRVLQMLFDGIHRRLWRPCDIQRYMALAGPAVPRTQVLVSG